MTIRKVVDELLVRALSDNCVPDKVVLEAVKQVEATPIKDPAGYRRWRRAHPKGDAKAAFEAGRRSMLM